MQSRDKKLTELDRWQIKLMSELNLLRSPKSLQKDLGLSVHYGDYLKRSKLNFEEIKEELSRSTIDVRKCQDCQSDYEGPRQNCPFCGTAQYKFDFEKNTARINYAFPEGILTNHLVEKTKIVHLHDLSESIPELPEKIRSDIAIFLKNCRDFIYSERKRRKEERKESAKAEKTKFTYFDPDAKPEPTSNPSFVVFKRLPRKTRTYIEIEADVPKWYEESRPRNAQASDPLGIPRSMREKSRLEELPPLQVCQK